MGRPSRINTITRICNIADELEFPLPKPGEPLFGPAVEPPEPTTLVPTKCINALAQIQEELSYSPVPEHRTIAMTLQAVLRGLRSQDS